MFLGRGSFERHRLLKLWWDLNQSQFKNARILHFVRGDAIERFVRELPNESFELIMCLHVLEGVNDKGVLRELHRILSKHGILVAMVSIMDGWENSDEDPADHVRVYAADFRKRILDGGFSVEECTPVVLNTIQSGLLSGGRVFVCHK